MLALLSLLAFAAPDDAGCRVAVLELQNKGLPADEAHLPGLLTEALAQAVSQVTPCKVLTQADLVAMMDVEATKMSCGQESSSCIAEIGQALGAKLIVAGSVGRLGASTIISARLLDLDKGAAETRADETVHGDPEALRDAARRVGRKLFGAPVDAAAGAAPSSSGVSPLVWGGAVVAVVGAGAAVGTGLGAGAMDGVLDDKTKTTGDKDGALLGGRLLLAAAGLSAVVAAVGVGLAAVGLGE